MKLRIFICDGLIRGVKEYLSGNSMFVNVIHYSSYMQVPTVQ